MASAQAQTAAQPTRRGGGYWRVLGRLFIGLLVALLVVSLAGAAIGVLFVQRTLPQTSGTLQVTGLHGKVSVLRDAWGVPHVTGNDLHDVIFAQGYVTAQDRLFQLEFNRRVAQGRLAELFGPGPDRSLVDADAFLRTLGMYSAAQTELAALDDSLRAELQAYADGINAFVNGHKGSLPLEFTVLGVTPDPWNPIDSLAYGRVVAYSLDGTWNTKYARAIVTAKIGTEAARTLFPPYPTENPTLIPTKSAGFAHAQGDRQQQALLPAESSAPSADDIQAFQRLSPNLLRGASVVRELVGDIHDGLGSNNWVVDGEKSATGKPLLANDPHLGIRMPAIWYEIGLRGGGLDVIGFSFPGDPGVVIGHNNYIAWGVTNVDADNTDLYLEKLDPTGHPGMYQYDREWRPLQTRQEVIKVRGEDKPVPITVTSTVHGPLVNSVVDDLKLHPDAAPSVALKWTALQPGYTFVGFFQLDFARNWSEFDAAVSNISISQNFVYADTDGNIGYRMSGVLPIRPLENGTLPVNGSTSAHEWNGYVAQAEMPRLYNPANHMIVTANNQIVDNSFAEYVTSDWDYGYRARRITDLLGAASKVSVGDYQRIQDDTLSLPASKLAPQFIAAGSSSSGDAAAAAKILSGWDFTMGRDSAAAAVYEATAGALARGTMEPALGKDVYTVYRDNLAASGVFTVLINLLDQPTAPFITSSPNEVIVKALNDAMRDLRGALGSDTSKWRWGALHQAHFAHPLASIFPLNFLFDIAPLDRPGDSVTVNAAGGGGFSADPANYQQRTVPSMRQIIDLGNFDNSLWVITTGESGQPGSAHYSDLAPLWDQSKYQPMYFSPGKQAGDAAGILTLKP
jgi:penicillin amidase